MRARARVGDIRVVVFKNSLVRLVVPELIDCPLNGVLTLDIVRPLLVDRDKFIDLMVVKCQRSRYRLPFGT